MAIQELGARGKVVYKRDDGSFQILTKDLTYINIAGVGAGAAAGTIFDPANVPSPLAPATLRFSPRGFWWQSDVGNIRRFIVCYDVTSNLYNSSTITALTIDGTAGRITGRVGEKVSF